MDDLTVLLLTADGDRIAATPRGMCLLTAWTSNKPEQEVADGLAKVFLVDGVTKYNEHRTMYPKFCPSRGEITDLVRFARQLKIVVRSVVPLAAAAKAASAGDEEWKPEEEGKHANDAMCDEAEPGGCSNENMQHESDHEGAENKEQKEQAETDTRLPTNDYFSVPCARHKVAHLRQDTQWMLAEMQVRAWLAVLLFITQPRCRKRFKARPVHSASSHLSCMIWPLRRIWTASSGR